MTGRRCRFDEWTEVFGSERLTGALLDLWLPKFPSGMIPRDSGGRDMISIDDRNYQNAVVDPRLADQIA